MRALVLGCAAVILLAGIGVAAPLVTPPEVDSLVEGHTVFTIVEVARVTRSEEVHFGAAVAVLVREHEVAQHAARFPGVLWFNDQYLVDPVTVVASDEETVRYPCTGAVLAVNEGDPIPVDPAGIPYVDASAAYVESYFVTDPLDHTWNVDKWLVENRTSLWSVAILGTDAIANESDDGECAGSAFGEGACAGAVDIPEIGCVGPRSSVQGLPRPNANARSPGEHGWSYPCGDPAAPCPQIEYNALLYFRLDDLRVASTPKDHRWGSADWNDDVSGCHAETNWTCPDANDDREGNSHPYQPDGAWPARSYDGRNNHGGSAPCGADCHATRRLDVTYGYARVPDSRQYWLTDTVGSAAPYHCHETTFCGPFA